jgi:hypothetical protein
MLEANLLALNIATRFHRTIFIGHAKLEFSFVQQKICMQPRANISSSKLYENCCTQFIRTVEKVKNEKD